jgi:alpha-amylase/alpha-mannosidase (GH57 family)
MGINPLYLTIHGHFYQPPRENPWTGLVELQESAAPSHDWNARISDQCYSPNGVSRILSPNGHIEAIVNNYSYMSFNIGPTLMSWIRTQRPNVYMNIKEGDVLSAERLEGHGNAIAQVYNHIIMPLASKRDKITQIRWGIQDFEFHFNRKPEGMWLAETAINMDTVVALIEEGIKFTILSPKQAASFRALTNKDNSGWVNCSDGSIDTSKAYRIIPRDISGKRICEGHLDVFFYDAELSSAVGFEHLLKNGAEFGKKILNAKDKIKTGHQLVSIGTDGESYGHHEPFGDMCVAWLFEKFCPQNNIIPVNYGWYLEKNPSEFEVQIKGAYGEGSAWSCAHGVGRWYRDCGCSTGGGPNWNQKWREPLRQAFDRVKKVADEVFEREFPVLSDLQCWDARNKYIDVLLESENQERREEFASAVLRNHTEMEDKVNLFSLLEIQKFCLYSYTSCGWFFNDIEGLEPVQNLRYCLRAIELLKNFLPDENSLSTEVLTILSKIKSNEHGKTGTEIWAEWVRPKIPIPYLLIAAEAVKLHLKLSHQSSSNIKVSSIKSKDNQLILNATYTNPETYESKSACALVVTDSIGRVKIILQTDNANSKRIPIFAEKEAIDKTDFSKLYPNAFVFRLHELPQDILAEINENHSKAKLSSISKELLDFSGKFGINLDCLADRTGSLITPLRQGTILNLTMKTRELALEILYNDDAFDSDSAFVKIKEIKEDLDALGVPLKSTLLDKPFMERLVKLISRVQEMQNQGLDNNDKLRKLVNKITELITVADWLCLDINKNHLENQSYYAYLLFKENRLKYSILQPMFQWLNFEV